MSLFEEKTGRPLGELNDVGQPWRFEDEDGLTVTRSCPWSPPGCHPVGCGVKFYVNDEGRLVKVEGDENHPVTKGRLCPRCIAFKDYEYNPSRIVHPMKRAREDRGKADAWEIITWDEAFEIIEKRYWEIVEEYGFESVVVFKGTGREGGTLDPVGSMVFHTPNFCYPQSGFACYAPRLAATSYIAGVAYPELDYAAALPGGYDDPLYQVPECIVAWGKEPLASNPDGMFGHAVIDLMRRGARLISVDPRVNWLSTRADYHLRLRPGTDAAMAMAWLNVIISEKLYDEVFVDCWTYGFDELAERVSDMTPEKVSGICGVDADEIRAAARMYASAKPAAIMWGLAIDQNTNGMQAGQCIVALMSITANMDVPGGQLISANGLEEKGFNYKDTTGVELYNKMIGLAEYPAYCGLMLDCHADLTLRAFETDEPYPLKMAFWSACNLLSCTSMEPERWYKALTRSLEFGVGFDAFMTPSIQATCEIFLPLATCAAREGTVATHYGAAPAYTGFMNKCIDEGDTRSDMELAFELGKRLHPEFWTNYDSVRDFINHLRLHHVRDFEDARKEVVIQAPNIDYYKYEKGTIRRDGKLGFNTVTGRIELFTNAYYSFGDDPLPYYSEPDFGPVSTPELMEEYPFILTTGARTYAFFHSEHRQIPYLRELNPDPIVEVNPKVAAELKISDGQWCRVFNMYGSVVLKAKVTVAVDEKTIHCQHGWWFPEEDGNAPYLYGTFRSNINQLIPNFHFGKLGFGAPVKCMICNIEPISECYDTDMNLIWEKFGKLV